MSVSRNSWRGVSVVTSVQVVILMLIEIILTQRLAAVSGGVRNALSQHGASPAQIELVNSVFLGLMTETLWVFLAALAVSLLVSAVAIKILRRRERRDLGSKDVGN